MNKKLKIPVIILIILSLIIFIIVSVNSYMNEPFNVKNYNLNSNKIINLSDIPYADDILYAGFNELSIDSINVIVSKLSPNLSESLFNNGELHIDALIYKDGSSYMIYVTNKSRRKMIEILSHELIHLKQMIDGRLINKKTYIEWEGKSYTDIPYSKRKWEIEAFDEQFKLKSKIEKRLYN